MRFAVVTLGSAGDLHPFLAVARELSRRGHEVHLLSQAPYQHQVEREGVRFRAVVTAADHERTLTHPLLWHPINGFGVLWRHLCVPAIEATCEALGELAHRDQDSLVVFASPLAVGARFARDRWPQRIRLLTGYTAPMGLRDVTDPMFVGEWRVPSWMPKPARRGLWHALDRWKLEPMARPILDGWQQTWKTSPITGSIFGDWLHSPDGGLALYPDWFATVPDSWRARGVVQGGFPVYEPHQVEPLPDHLKRFLDAHEDTIVIYPGSAGGSSSHFIDMALAACQAEALPAVVLSPHLYSGLDEARAIGETSIAVRQATLSLLLPHSAAFVHHGGIGSVAQALAHAVPQIILASAYDQFENGTRVEKLAAGLSFSLRKADAGRIVSGLRAVLSRKKPAPRENGDKNSLGKLCESLEIEP